MTARLLVDGTRWTQVEKHLAAGPDEQLAFLLVRWDGEDAHAFDVRLVSPAGFDVQLPWHLALADSERAAIIKWAHDLDGALVEVHVHHNSDPAVFSPTDRVGLGEFVPHIWWRLGHRPYVALVVGGGTFDALVWRRSPHAPESLGSLVVADRPPRAPTGRSLRLGP